MNKIRISVIMVTYNHEKYIIQAMEGVLMQKCDFKFEVLIHDDASTDNSSEIIREYELKYPDIIKPIYQKVNQYSQKKNIWGDFQFSRAKGEYIAICEGDDYWIDPMKLQKQIDFLENNKDYQMVFSRCEELGNKGARKINICYNKEYFDTDIFNQWLIPTASVLFRNNLTIEDYKIFNNPNILFGDFYLFLIQPFD